MADNVLYNSTGTTVIATDERSIGSQTVHLQRVVGIGMSNITITRATPTTSASQMAPARETRLRAVVFNDGLVDVFIGNSGVTVSTGFKLVPGAALTIHSTAAIFAVIASGSFTSGALHILEEHD